MTLSNKLPDAIAEPVIEEVKRTTSIQRMDLFLV